MSAATNSSGYPARSSIARAADHAFYTHAGLEIGVASTKAFTTQLAALYLLVELAAVVVLVRAFGWGWGSGAFLGRTTARGREGSCWAKATELK